MYRGENLDLVKVNNFVWQLIELCTHTTIVITVNCVGIDIVINALLNYLYLEKIIDLELENIGKPFRLLFLVRPLGYPFCVAFWFHHVH